MKLSAILAPMLEAGIAPDIILEVVKAFEAEQERQPDPLKKRRAADRERLRRYKARRGISENEWMTLSGQVYARDGKICRYCSDETGPFCIDHFVPLARGGSNDIGNLGVACQACNSSKAGLLYEEWRGQQE